MVARDARRRRHAASRPRREPAALIVSLALAAIWLEPYRRTRLLSFLDPWADPEGAGFQTVQAMIALGSGGFLGVGLGESVQKIYYLPEASTDMIFAIVGEELGLVGTMAVVGAFAVFALRGLHDRPARARPVRQAPRRRDHGARRGPGDREPERRPRDRAADRHPAPLRQLRRLEPDRLARRRRHPP